MNKDQRLLEEAYQSIYESSSFELTESEEEILEEVTSEVLSIISNHEQQLIDLLLSRNNKPLSYRWDGNNSIMASLTAGIRNGIARIVKKHLPVDDLLFVATSLYLAPFYDFDIKLDKNNKLLFAFQAPQQVFEMEPPRYVSIEQIKDSLVVMFKDWTARKKSLPITKHDKEYIESRESDLIRKHKNIERTKELSRDFKDLEVLKDF